MKSTPERQLIRLSRLLESNEGARFTLQSNHYAVTNRGRVFSFFGGNGNGLYPWRDGPREMKKWTTHYGHYEVRLSVDGRIIRKPVHHLVQEVWGEGPKPLGLQCRHLDGNHTNNVPENLRWGTVQENALDREQHGSTYAEGAHHRAKLTVNQVREIRRRLAAGAGPPVLSKEFGVTRENIYIIRDRKSWRHVC